MEFLHPAMWHDHDIDFARWLHPAMWHVALESRQWIHQVAAPCNWQMALGWYTIEFAQTSAILKFYILFWFRPHHRSRHVIHSLCTSLQKFIQIGPPSAEKNDVMSIFKMADLSHLGFYGSNNGFLKCPCTTSCRSSIDTIALNCLVFEKNAFFCILAADRLTKKLTNRWRAPTHWAALAVASGGLINNGKRFIMNVSEMKK